MAAAGQCSAAAERLPSIKMMSLTRTQTANMFLSVPGPGHGTVIATTCHWLSLLDDDATEMPGHHDVSRSSRTRMLFPNSRGYKGGGSPHLYYHDCSGGIPGHTTRAPPVRFELNLKTNGFQFYAIANLDKTSRNAFLLGIH